MRAVDVTLGELMSASVKTIAPDVTLGEAARLMSDAPFSCLVVHQHGRLLGILTERDMVTQLHGRSAPSYTRFRNHDFAGDYRPSGGHLSRRFAAHAPIRPASSGRDQRCGRGGRRGQRERHAQSPRIGHRRQDAQSAHGDGSPVPQVSARYPGGHRFAAHGVRALGLCGGDAGRDAARHSYRTRHAAFDARPGGCVGTDAAAGDEFEADDHHGRFHPVRRGQIDDRIRPASSGGDR